MKNDIISHPVFSWDNQQKHYCGFGKKRKIWRVRTSRRSDTDRNHKESLEALVKVFFISAAGIQWLIVTHTRSWPSRSTLSASINACECFSWLCTLLSVQMKIGSLGAAEHVTSDSLSCLSRFQLWVGLRSSHHIPGLETEEEKPARLWPVAWSPGQSPAVQAVAAWRSWYCELVEKSVRVRRLDVNQMEAESGSWSLYLPTLLSRPNNLMQGSYMREGST